MLKITPAARQLTKEPVEMISLRAFPDTSAPASPQSDASGTPRRFPPRISFSEAARHGSRFMLIALLVACLGGASGCRREEKPVTFEPNLVRAHQIEMSNELDMSQVVKDTQWLLHQKFGTPNNPKLPKVITEDESLSALVSAENLARAAGPADAETGGLYRAHCAICHGVTGNGRGPKAALSTPYPRDYRLGIFKYKSTKRGAKPTREDIARSIRGGIPGTAMVTIPELNEDAVQALTDYVIYLSIRGELERAMYDIASYELEEGDRIITPEWADSPEGSEERAEFEEQMGYIDEDIQRLAGEWLDAEEAVVEVPPSGEIPVPANYDEFQAMLEGEQADALKASVQRGQQLFVGKIALCSKCHGEQGKGDGQTDDFDDWTKDWTVRAGLDPKNYDALVPLIARGALPPNNVQPRNFAEGVFRGGSRPEDLYRRIVEGIAGTPMPAATFVEGEFEQQDVWHLINFIRSLDEGERLSEPEPSGSETVDVAQK